VAWPIPSREASRRDRVASVLLALGLLAFLAAFVSPVLLLVHWLLLLAAYAWLAVSPGWRWRAFAAAAALVLVVAVGLLATGLTARGLGGGGGGALSAEGTLLAGFGGPPTAGLLAGPGTPRPWRLAGRAALALLAAGLAGVLAGAPDVLLGGALFGAAALGCLAMLQVVRGLLRAATPSVA
jgi:hypothetical protein